MNEIIDDLKNQALEWAMETLDPDQVNEYEWAAAIDKKFAELLIKECIGKINSLKNITADEMIGRGYRDWNSYKGALDRAKKKIRKHFGVKA